MSTLQVRQREAHIAYTRFGLGAKRGQFGAIVDDPREALNAELSTRGIASLHRPHLPSHADACAAAGQGTRSREIYRDEIIARLNKANQPTIGFVERLVYFWSNHFNVSANSGGPARSAVGEMERNRIRPNVLGNFRNLFRAAISHPAMVHYLQNGLSVGPQSAFGRQSRRGINENLGRELLELHSVGVSAGYTQADVRNTSLILTGWSTVTPWQADNNWEGGRPEYSGRFIYRQNWQEPGTHSVLGRSYSQTGISKVHALLDQLAVNRSTAQHVAFKLVKHFITDTPAPNLVNPVANAFLNSDGDLPTTYRALLALPAAWSVQPTKFRPPFEMFVAQARAIDMWWTNDEANPLINGLEFLTHKPWEWDPPDGFPDDSDFWRTPDALYTRIAVTQTIIRRHLQRRNITATPQSFARGVFGPNITERTLSELSRSRNTLQGLVTFLSSPGFLQR